MSAQPSEAIERTTRIVLERSWVKSQLIHELARQEHTQAALAKRYGVGGPAITAFKRRHATEIATVRADIENEFAGLWIADKRTRLAALQDDADYVEIRLRSTELEDALREYIDAADDEERKHRAERVADALSQDPQWMRLRHQTLRAAAEELGQIPNKTTLSFDTPVTVRHVLEGVDVEGL